MSSRQSSQLPHEPRPPPPGTHGSEGAAPSPQGAAHTRGTRDSIPSRLQSALHPQRTENRQSWFTDVHRQPVPRGRRRKQPDCPSTEEHAKRRVRPAGLRGPGRDAPATRLRERASKAAARHRGHTPSRRFDGTSRWEVRNGPAGRGGCRGRAGGWPEGEAGDTSDFLRK